MVIGVDARDGGHDLGTVHIGVGLGRGEKPLTGLVGFDIISNAQDAVVAEYLTQRVRRICTIKTCVDNADRHAFGGDVGFGESLRLHLLHDRSQFGFIDGLGTGDDEVSVHGHYIFHKIKLFHFLNLLVSQFGRYGVEPARGVAGLHFILLEMSEVAGSHGQICRFPNWQTHQAAVFLCGF